MYALILFGLLSVAADHRDVPAGYKCEFINIHGKEFRRCGRITRPTHQLYCEPMRFTDHMDHKHKYILCTAYDSEVRPA